MKLAHFQANSKFHFAIKLCIGISCRVCPSSWFLWRCSHERYVKQTSLYSGSLLDNERKYFLTSLIHNWMKSWCYHQSKSSLLWILNRTNRFLLIEILKHRPVEINVGYPIKEYFCWAAGRTPALVCYCVVCTYSQVFPFFHS